MYVLDVTAVVIYAAFIVLVLAYLVLAKWYGPEKAREMMDIMREAARDFTDVMKEGFKTLKDLKEYAEKKEKEEEG